MQIRIGINNLGGRAFLDRSAENGLSDAVASEVEDCAEAVVSAARAIRAAQPSVYIVLVGVLNNSDWPPYFGYWQTATEQQNIGAVLDAFDERLALMASTDPRMAFFDDRAWFASHWGGRDAAGKPAYRTVVLGEGIEIGNTQGNGPLNAILADGHAGSILNAIWARDFIAFLNDRFDLGLTPVSDAELLQFAESVLEAAEKSPTPSG